MNIDAQKIIEVIRSTRSFSLPYFGKVEIKAQKSESPGDVVTEIDQQIETYLKAELVKLMPEVAFVGEEFGGNRESDSFWLVDPIDGTGDFIRGIPFCTTMLALIENKQVVFSAIYDFVHDIMYHAELGKGAFMNGGKISVSNRPLRGAYMSFEINTKTEANQLLFQEIRSRAGLIHALAAGYEFILVATGKTDGRLTYDAFGKDYDYAPGSLLVSEAGGIVKNFKSDSYDHTNLNFIAANPLVYEELIKSENSIEKLMG